MILPPNLVNALIALAQTIPPHALEPFLTVLDRAEAITDWRSFKHEAQRRAPSQSDVRAELGRLIDRWEREAPTVPPRQLLGAVQLAVATIGHERARQELELVWTGPQGKAVALRNTKQALKQLIDEATTRLLIVSFAVYDIPDVVAALLAASARGVQIRILVENYDRSRRQYRSQLRAFGPLREKATIYGWPLEQRPQNESGDVGLLHVKCAVADGRGLFLSSANLTHYALTLNIEMGILVHGGPLPTQVETHFTDLIRAQTFVPLDA